MILLPLDLRNVLRSCSGAKLQISRPYRLRVPVFAVGLAIRDMGFSMTKCPHLAVRASNHERIGFQSNCSLLWFSLRLPTSAITKSDIGRLDRPPRGHRIQGLLKSIERYVASLAP